MSAPEEDGVTIRMYREILGDCFLLTVTEKGVRKHILIDCGVLQSVVSGDAMMEKLPAEVTERSARSACARSGPAASRSARSPGRLRYRQA